MKKITYVEKRFFEWHEDGVSVSLRAKSGSYGGGSEVLIVCGDDMSYQNVTGCLSQGAHPGSYNGQDAYNDMLVVDDGICDPENRNIQNFKSKSHIKCKRLQGCNGSDSRGGLSDE